MRKLLYLIPVASLLLGCSADEPQYQYPETEAVFSESPLTHYRTIDEVLAIAAEATNFLANNGKSSQIDSRGIGRAIDFRVPVYSVTNTRSRKLKDTTLGPVITYLSYNWGWRGYDDGYFIDGLMHVKESILCNQEDHYSLNRECIHLQKSL